MLYLLWHFLSLPYNYFEERKKEHGYNPHHGHIAFVKSGDTSNEQTTKRSSIQGGTTGGNMEVDSGKRLVFPVVVQTTLRPDVVLWPKTGKKLIVIKLTDKV